MTKNKGKHHGEAAKVPKQATKGKAGSVKKTAETQKSTSDFIGEATKTLFSDLYGMASQYGQSYSQQACFNPNLLNVPPQVPPPMASNSHQSDTPPPWVLELFKRLSCIEVNLASVDHKMSKLDAMEKKLTDLQTEMTSVSETVATLQTNYRTVSDKTEGLDFEMTVTQKQLEYLLESNASLKDELTDLKSRSMRDNLVFFNIPEQESEDTENVVRSFLEEKMKMPTDQAKEVKFERVHRAGPKLSHNRHRRIVAKFSNYKQREAVRSLGRNLAGSNFYVHEQFPPEIVDQRKKLYPIMKKARDEKKNAYISYNKLYIEGKLYHPEPNTSSAPKEADSERSAKRHRHSSS
jgi:hypothetical protein